MLMWVFKAGQSMKTERPLWFVIAWVELVAAGSTFDRAAIAASDAALAALFPLSAHRRSEPATELPGLQ